MRDCFIENVGPIRSLDLTLRFNADGTPKPLILVGPNGSGKTVFLAHVVDALTELAKKAYRDAVLGHQLGHSPYFKVTGGGNVRSGATYGACLLAFSGGGREFAYMDRAGALPEGHLGNLRDRFPLHTVQAAGEAAKTADGGKEAAESFFRECSVCFFPSSRHERPHWLNAASVPDVPVFGNDQRVIGLLGKPIVVESAGEATRQWLMDVVLDSRAEIDVTEYLMPGGTSPSLRHATVTDDLNDMALLKRCRSNAEEILRLIVQDPGATLAVNFRNRAGERLTVRRSDGTTLPSLDHMSAGQSVLFNAFTTIVRYADRADIMKSVSLEAIEGVVLIDEIDAHLHTSLQYETLPKLCRLFPRVQFVISSHAPLFVLGMESAYGADGFHLVEMPDGAAIGTERFAEFRQSFDYYTRTKTFEEGVARRVEDQLRAGSRPLVLTEGKIDSQYIRTALDLLGRADLLERLDVDCVGTAGVPNVSGSGSGKGSLDAAFSFLRDNPGFLRRPVLLLYDHDTNKKPAGVGRLTVRSIPLNPAHTKMKKGIENLFPDELFADSATTAPFVREKVKETDYLVSSTIREFDKQAFCDWMCGTRRNRDDFAGFGSIVQILEEFLAASA